MFWKWTMIMLKSEWTHLIPTEYHGLVWSNTNVALPSACEPSITINHSLVFVIYVTAGNSTYNIYSNKFTWSNRHSLLIRSNYSIIIILHLILIQRFDLKLTKKAYTALCISCEQYQVKIDPSSLLRGVQQGSCVY